MPGAILSVKRSENGSKNPPRRNPAVIRRHEIKRQNPVAGLRKGENKILIDAENFPDEIQSLSFVVL
jgi:hypothetical protein